MNKLFAVVLMLSGLASAECPVVVTKVWTPERPGRYATARKGAIGQPYNLRIHYENRSEKAVKHISFKVRFVDEFDKVIDPLYDGFKATKLSLKPGKKADSAWQYPFTTQNRADAWAETVVFEDGTKWQDPSGTCNIGVEGVIARGEGK